LGCGSHVILLGRAVAVPSARVGHPRMRGG
jgi:hypothetical protein